MIEWLAWRLEFLIPLVLSLTVHEWAHARAAFALGDDTASSLGRMSLDPFVHLDPVGSILLPLIGVPIGWAKPVPIRPERFRPGVDMTFGIAATAAAGPLANLAIVVLLWPLSLLVSEGPVADLLQFCMLLNGALALFNLLPVPPLDGSRLVEGLVPRRLRDRWGELVLAGPIVLVLVLVALFVGGFLG